jgi:hypothetical protein
MGKDIEYRMSRDMEYRTRVAVIRTSIGSKESFKDFKEKGINKAKEIIVNQLGKEMRKLSYVELELLVQDELKDVKIRNWTDGWKIDAFMLGLGELELLDKKIKESEGMFSLLKEKSYFVQK